MSTTASDLPAKSPPETSRLDPSERLAQSRDTLRILLLGRSGTGAFPRSTVLRAMLNPKYRAVVMSLAATALTFPKVRRVGRMAAIGIRMGQLGRALLRSRR